MTSPQSPPALGGACASPAHLVRVHVDPHQEDELGHEEAAAQVLVDGGPGALDLAEEPEGEDAHGQTDEGDDHAQLGDPGQDDAVGPQLRSKSNRRRFLFGSFTACRRLQFVTFGMVQREIGRAHV